MLFDSGFIFFQQFAYSASAVHFCKELDSFFVKFTLDQASSAGPGCYMET